MKILDYVRKYHDVGGDEAEFYCHDIDDTSSVQYFGFLTNDGNWCILKLDESGNPKTLRYCFGQSGYNFSNRAGLTYNPINTAL